ncbi:Elicitor-responsive protein 3 [Linum grandiflorum]
MSFVSGIQGQVLEVTVIGCTKLKDTEWLSRQDPYVCVEYGSNKSRTRTCTDGGKNPTFQEKFVFTLIEGLRELNVVVWNSNTLTFDDFIGNGRAQLQKVLAEGYDDSNWPLQTKTGRYAGEVRLIMHYANARKHSTSYAPSQPPPCPSHVPPPYSMYSAPPPANTSSYYYPYAPSPYSNPPQYPSYPPNPSPAYPLLPTPYSPSPYGQSPSPYPPPGSHGHYYPPPSPY